MRRALAVCFVVLGTVPAVSGQSPPTGPTHVLLSQGVSDGKGAVLEIQRSAFYLGEPSVSIPALPSRGSWNLTASRFSVRAWREGDQTRMVIYAVARNAADTRDLETPIAIYGWPSVHPGVSEYVVTETEQWGAIPIVLTPSRPIDRSSR